ncbi:patatin-like phospholipase family protein [Parabacteroides johnsonii]|uniref:patatin-like phospholipase family protein n=1 Tax=Parabacteroides johnsonii TaxID=387661 RepID=UPI0024302440|nr:patatin-like phospholipase family protein [Parabacteroides johnsonii]MBS6224491.1 patatin-like phospholipase family protein [Parabacteroides johnsonii]
MEKLYTKYFTSCKGVFQGGGCKAIAYIGAYKKAYERGVFFSELAGTSAGSIIASLIAAGAKPNYLEKIVNEINFSDFIKDFKKPNAIVKWCMKALSPKKVHRYCDFFSIQEFIHNYGIFDSRSIEIFVENHLKKLTGLEKTVTFKDLIPDLHIVCADLERHTVKVWNKNNTPSESVAKAVRCSCSIPFFFQPVDNKYVDGGILSNLPSFIFTNEPHYNRILNFKLENDDSYSNILSCSDFIISLIDTIVEGASGIQQSLGVKSFNVSIKIKNINSTDFNKVNKDIIQDLIQRGEKAMDDFLDDELTFISENHHMTRILVNKEQMRSLVSYISLEKQKEIYVSCENTHWCWELFLSLVRWINFGTKVTVFTSPITSINSEYLEEEKARRRMLRAMKVRLIDSNPILVNGYFFEEKKDIWKAIVFKEDIDKMFTANYFNGKIDSVLIKELMLKLKEKISLLTFPKSKMITIKSVNQSEIIELLKSEPIYERANLRFETVKLDELYFMNPYIRALKYKQIDEIYELYNEAKIPPFTSAALYFDQKKSLIGPPVAEKHNDKLYLIEGNTRCVYAYKHGIDRLQILVVYDVETPIPCDTEKTYKISDILISDKKVRGEGRYVDFDYSGYRHIEKSIRPYETYMKEV